MQDLKVKVTSQAALIYSSISLVLAFLFLLVTFLTGENYTPVARIGGMVWVFILSMIITMPIIISAVNKKVMG